MKKEEKAPLIVEGELYTTKRYKTKINRTKTKEVKLPTKRFTIVDIILTLVGIAMIVYGVYGLVNHKDTKKDKKKSIEFNIYMRSE